MTVSRLGLSRNPTTPGDQRPAATTRFRVFTVLWAVGGMAHLTNNGGQGFDHPAGWFTLAAAVYLLCDPGSVRRLALFAAAQLAEVILIAPFWADHQLLMAAVNLSILVRVATLRRGDGTDSQLNDAGGFVTRHASSMQVLLLIAYSAAALAKYNTTFLDPLTSCATFIADQATGGLLDGTGGSGRLHVLGAIVPETLIPIVLLIPATRRLGVRFAVLFHLLVSGSPFVAVEDFTLVLYPLFLLFLPDADIAAIADWASKQLASGPIAGLVRRLRPDSVRTVVLSLGIVAMATQGGAYWLLLFWLSGLAIGSVLLGILILNLRRPGGIRPTMNRIAPSQLGVSSCLLLLALSPYLGFRTTGVFTMFSNLQTSGPGTNHVFMPSWNLTDLQNDLVVPGSGSSDHFDEMIEDGYALHYFELGRLIAEEPDAVLVGTRNGRPINVSSESGEIGRPSIFERKILQFRTVPDTGDPLCTN